MKLVTHFAPINKVNNGNNFNYTFAINIGVPRL
jgi:hypothetical protein